MFFLFGSRWKSVPLGELMYDCSHCSKETYHTAVVHKGNFTVFFIPLFPIGKKYMIICNLCGRKLQAVANLKQQLSNWEQTGQLGSA